MIRIPMFIVACLGLVLPMFATHVQASDTAVSRQAAAIFESTGVRGGLVVHLGCGDGRLRAGETCDDGSNIPGDGCVPTCQIEVCGNGVLDASEICDDGIDQNCDGGDGDFWHGVRAGSGPRCSHATGGGASSAAPRAGSGRVQRPGGRLRGVNRQPRGVTP